MNQKSKLSLGVSLIDRRKQSSDCISVYRALPKIIPNYFTCGRRYIGGVGECGGGGGGDGRMSVRHYSFKLYDRC